MSETLKVLALSLSLSIFSTGSIAKASEANNLLNLSDKTIEQQQVKNKLIGKSTSYIKFTLKDSAKNKEESEITDDDYVIEKSNNQEFNTDKRKRENEPKSGNRVKRLTYWEDSYSSVVKLDLAVYQTAHDKNRFIASQTFEWSREPHGPGTDAVGLRVDPGMVIHKNSITGSSIAKGNTTSNRFNTKDGSYKHTSLGAGYALNPKMGCSNSGNIQAEITFSQLDAGKQYGNIYGYYIKSSVTGSLSLDVKGMPSIGFSMTSDEYRTSVIVNNFGE